MSHWNRQSLKLVLWLALWAASSYTVWGQIGVSTLSVDFTLAPGEGSTGAIEVFNNGKDPRQFTLQLADYDRNTECGLVLLSAGTHPRSLARFISVSTVVFSLSPSQSQQIRYNVTIPDDQRGPLWVALVLTSPIPATSSAQPTPITIGAAEQFIIKVRRTDPTNAINLGRLTEAQVLLPEEGRPLRVFIDYENIGTTFQQPKGEVRFINAKGDTVAKVDIQPFPMLPGGHCRLEIPLEQRLAPGDYVALVIIDFGGEFLLGAQTRFTIR